MPIPLAALAAATAAMKVGKAVANAASPTGGSATPSVPVQNQSTPDKTKYQNNTPQPDLSANPNGTEAQVTTDADGRVNTGESVPKPNTGGTDTYQDYKARTQTASATRYIG